MKHKFNKGWDRFMLARYISYQSEAVTGVYIQHELCYPEVI